ncbi:MAG: sporulation transcription factor Spo0A [Clostridiales bacterium]|nr:sporulation transcription factor Spo0A [Clostridiales bacterium]
MNQVRVLVAEDDQAQRENLVRNLGKYQDILVVGAAENGVEAVRMVWERNPEVIICDMVMPQMDGFGVMREISNMAPDYRPKVIALTALSRNDFIARAMELGVSYYMLKPADLKFLVQQIRQLAKNAPVASLSEAENPEQVVAEMLQRIGIPVHLNGYRFLLRSALMVLDHPECLTGITRTLYPAVAHYCNTTASRVERSIRHAINMTWERGGVKAFERVLTWRAFSAKDKPTNCELIALVYEKVRLAELAGRR